MRKCRAGFGSRACAGCGCASGAGGAYRLTQPLLHRSSLSNLRFSPQAHCIECFFALVNDSVSFLIQNLAFRRLSYYG